MAVTPKKTDIAQRGISFPCVCQSTSPLSHGAWYNFPNAIRQHLFFHGNVLTDVSLACGHQAGKNFVMEPETWPDYMFCNKTPKFT